MDVRIVDCRRVGLSYLNKHETLDPAGANILIFYIWMEPGTLKPIRQIQYNTKQLNMTIA